MISHCEALAIGFKIEVARWMTASTSFAPPVSSITLHVAHQQMILHRVQHDLRYLCSGSVIEENKIAATVQRGKGIANPRDREVRRRGFTAAEVADRSPRRCRQTWPDISDTVGSRRISPRESGGRHPVPSRRSGRENEPE